MTNKGNLRLSGVNKKTEGTRMTAAAHGVIVVLHDTHRPLKTADSTKTAWDHNNRKNGSSSTHLSIPRYLAILCFS